MSQPDQRWTAEEGALSRFEDFAEHILEALADAGLLLPPGGTWREEVGVSADVFAGGGTAAGIAAQATHKRAAWDGPWIEVPS